MESTITIEIETNLEEVRGDLIDLEDALMGVRDEAEALAELAKEQSVFEVSLGQGITFKGTKSDFEAFVAGMIKLQEFADKYTF